MKKDSEAKEMSHKTTKNEVIPDRLEVGTTNKANPATNERDSSKKSKISSKKLSIRKESTSKKSLTIESETGEVENDKQL